MRFAASAVLVGALACIVGCDEPAPATKTPIVEFEVVETTPPIAAALPPLPIPLVDEDPSDLTVAEFVGAWTLTDYCNEPSRFYADGAFARGEATGRWSLNGGRLTIVEDGRTSNVTLNPFSENVIAYGDPGGLLAMYRRC
ncbi:MAG: hypothetical protein NW203_07695 [Hyphomonadaceae bacterium]|nr:hypothetical protein [Hyphomonadaceae bacterium]